jgi:hypothetical protein
MDIIVFSFFALMPSKSKLLQDFGTTMLLKRSGTSISSEEESMVVEDWTLLNLLDYSQYKYSYVNVQTRNSLLAFQIQVQKMHSDNRRCRHG